MSETSTYFKERQFMYDRYAIGMMIRQQRIHAKVLELLPVHIAARKCDCVFPAKRPVFDNKQKRQAVEHFLRS